MKKIAYISLDYARYYNPEYGKELMEVPKVDDKSSKPSDSLIRLIYAPDKTTRLPKGDLSFWVSDKVNPQIKEYILNHLLMDTSSVKGSALPAGISDDDAFMLSRHSGESVMDYVNRLNEQIVSTKWINEQYRQSISPKSEDVAVSSE